jgi:hypothetical protein
VLGIRTASHAFGAREFDTNRLVDWPEFDPEILGGNYHGHYGRIQNGMEVAVVPGMEEHVLLQGTDPEGFRSPCTLYEVRPLKSRQAQVLLTGSIPDKPPEPVLWINRNRYGTAIYTSLGHFKDWENENFRHIIFNAVDYLLDAESR